MCGTLSVRGVQSQSHSNIHPSLTALSDWLGYCVLRDGFKPVDTPVVLLRHPPGGKCGPTSARGSPCAAGGREPAATALAMPAAKGLGGAPPPLLPPMSCSPYLY
jgi:hypothetical protein